MKMVPISTMVMSAILAACSSQPDASPEQAGSNSASSADADQPTADSADVKPSFDCAKAGSDAEEMVCSDRSLAKLDNEMTRLFALAEKDANILPAARAELKAMQRGWIKGRDDCWKAGNKRQCVLASYGMRIHELRQGYANARSADPASVSIGPVVFKCDGIDAPIGVTMLAIEPGFAYLQNGATAVMFTADAKAPDARYTGIGADNGAYVLVTKGKEAFFTRPDAREAVCTMDEIG